MDIEPLISILHGCHIFVIPEAPHVEPVDDSHKQGDSNPDTAVPEATPVEPGDDGNKQGDSNPDAGVLEPTPLEPVDDGNKQGDSNPNTAIVVENEVCERSDQVIKLL